MKIKRQFYARPTLTVARELLGKVIIRKIGKRKVYGIITETEAYIGPNDKAAHSFGGKRTSRTEPMFKEGGHAYIYLIYGIYWLFNISTNKKEHPEAVLIRAIVPTTRTKNQVLRTKSEAVDGPGKVGRYLKIDKSLSGIDLVKSRELWLEDWGIEVSKIKKTPRIGIDYAEEFVSKPWRFISQGISH